MKHQHLIPLIVGDFLLLRFRPPQRNILLENFTITQDAAVSSAVEDLGSLMDSSAALFEVRAATVGVIVKRDYRRPGQLYFRGDEVRQVFANLLSNALDAVRGGGKIRVRITRVKGWDEARTEGLRVSVGDTGEGIPVEIREKVFEAFVTTKDATRTGLGLWVSLGIVQKHGGRIAMHTRLWQGTVFRLVLPIDGLPARQGVASESGQ